MTDGVVARTPTSGADGLNALLRGELAAVNAYQRALRANEGHAVVDAAEILRFASEHQRTVAALQVAVREMGGVPASEAGTWGAFALLRDTATVRELLEGEQAGPVDVRRGARDPGRRRPRSGDARADPATTQTHRRADRDHLAALGIGASGRVEKA